MQALLRLVISTIFLLSPPVYSNGIPTGIHCATSLAKLRSPDQRRFTYKALNALAARIGSNADAFLSDTVRPVRNLEAKGSRRDALENWILEIELTGWPLEQKVRTLSELALIPEEGARLLFAYYRLTPQDWSKADLQKVLESTRHFPIDVPSRPLPLPIDDPLHRIESLSTLAPVLRAWLKGESVQWPANHVADALWDVDSERALLRFEALLKSKPADVSLQSFAAQNMPLIYDAFGTHVEKQQLQNLPNVLPGTAIRVNGLKHADGWRVRFENGNMLVDGFLESKSSASGLINGALEQHHGWVRRLARDPYGITLLGDRMPPERILLRTRHGYENLLDYSRRRASALETEADRSRVVSEDFSPDIYSVYVPAGENVEIPGFVHSILPSKKSRNQYREQFASAVQDRFALPGLKEEILTALHGTGNGLALSFGKPSELPPPRKFESWAIENQKELSGAFLEPADSPEARWFSAFTRDALSYFDDLAVHLPTDVQKRLREYTPVEKTDGAQSRRSGLTAGLRVQKRLYALVDAHNALFQPAIVADLNTVAGIRTALKTLQQSALGFREKDDPAFRLEVAWTKDLNLIESIERHTGGRRLNIYGSFSLDTPEYFRQHAQHLPLKVQQQIEAETPLSPGTGARARETKHALPRQAVGKRLHALVQAHNLNALPEDRIEKDLTTSEGVSEAFEKLRLSSNAARRNTDPDFEYQQVWLDNPQPLLDTFSQGRTGNAKHPFGAFTTDTDNYFDKHAAHLPTSVREAIRAAAPLALGSGSKASLGKKAPILAIANRLKEVVRAHNEAFPSEKIGADLTTPHGVANALKQLREKAATAGKPQIIHEQESAWTHRTDITQGFETSRKGPNSEHPPFTVDTENYFRSLSQHLPPEKQRILNETFPLISESGNIARRRTGSVNQRLRILERLRAIVQEHNTEAAKESKVDEPLTTATSVSKAVAILRDHSNRAQRRNDPDLDFVMSVAEKPELIKTVARVAGARAGFSKDAAQYFHELSTGLDEAARTEIETLAPLIAADGRMAVTGVRTAQQRIARRILALARARGLSIELTKIKEEAGLQETMEMLLRAARP